MPERIQLRRSRIVTVRFRRDPRRYHIYRVFCDHNVALGIDVQIGLRRARVYWRSCDGP